MTCYRQKARHLSNEMGSVIVDQIKAEHVERYIQAPLAVVELKGKTVARVVAIHSELHPVLEALHRGTGPVVRPWTNMVRDLSQACKRAEVPRRTANDLRRTFASWLIQGGVSNRIVADLMGHGTTRMVDMVYGKLDEATRHAAIAKLPGYCDAGVPNRAPRAGTEGGRYDNCVPTITNGNEQRSSTDCADRGWLLRRTHK